MGPKVNISTSEQFTKFLYDALQNEAIQEQVSSLLGQHLMEKISKVEQENKRLKERVTELEWVVDDLEQYGRRNCLRITNNWPERAGEDTDKMCLDLFKKYLKVDLSESDIGRSHRVGKPIPGTDVQHRPIIIRFVTYRAREKVYRARSKLKNNKEVYLNDDLTKKRDTLAFQARVLKRGGHIRETWVYDSKIFLKDQDDRRWIITRPADLAKFNPTTGRSATNQNDQSDPIGDSSSMPRSAAARVTRLTSTSVDSSDVSEAN